MIPAKICGITNLMDAQCAIDSGAAAIGFIFYPKSPRNISLLKAKKICKQLSGTVSCVGVFVNHKKAFIDEAITEIPLDSIQFHGDESPDFCNQFDIPVLKAIRIKNADSLKKIESYSVSGFLLDTFSDEHYGGTGIIFDWSLLKNNYHKPIIISGGLNPNNILSAISSTNPIAVDVNSGVESSPGKKDHKKIKSLFQTLLNTKSTGFHFG